MQTKFASFVLLLGLLTACGGLGRPVPAGEEACIGEECDSGSGVACLDDNDCLPGESCVDEVCVGGEGSGESDTGGSDDGPVSCQTTNDCPFGEFCDLGSGTCVGCLLDEHCDSGEVCLSNKECGVAGQDGCATNADCPASLVCDSSSAACVECVTASDCSIGESCIAQRCVDDGQGGGAAACSSDADCSVYGQICDPISLTCAPCTTDEQCGIGYACSAGICVNDSGTGGGTGGCDPLLEMEDCDGTCVSILIGTLFIGDGACDGAYPVNFNCAEYSYDGGDCSAAGGGSTDTGGTDPGSGTNTEYTCNESSFSAQTASATNANQAVVYSALSASATPANYFAIEVFQSATFNGPTSPGTYTLSASDNYADCGLCVLYQTDCNLETGSCDTLYFARGGSVTFSSLPPSQADTISGTISGLQLEEVTINADTFVSTPVPGGAGICMDTVTFSATVESGMCENTCEWAGDGYCDDGGSNSSFSVCELGTDCADCGIR